MSHEPTLDELASRATASSRQMADKSRVSRLPVMDGDGYQYGGEYVVTCPMINRVGAGALEVTQETISIIVGPGQASALTARFLSEAINSKLEREYINGGS